MRRLIAMVLAMQLLGHSEIVLAEDVVPERLVELNSEMDVLKSQVEKLKSIVGRQQEKIEALESTKATTITSVAGESPQPAQISTPSTTGNGSGKMPFIPDIGVVGDIVGTLSDTLPNDEGNDRVSMRELELVFGSDVDPYSRFDATLTFSDFESPDVEEAYVSYWDLPFGLKARIGRMHQIVGKAAATHRDILETVDEPLVVQKYLGVEGLFRTGVDFSGFLPFATDSYTPQFTLGMMEGGVGEGGEMLAEARERPSFYGHVSNYLDLSDSSSFEVGGTYLLGSSDPDSYEAASAFGTDITFIHHFSPINKFKLASEFYFNSRESSSTTGDDNEIVALDSDPFGFYILADDRLSERWGLGSRYDWVQPIQVAADNSADADQAISAYLTFYQSEFARWRLQYQRAFLADGRDDDRFFLQGTFAIGTHKH